MDDRELKTIFQFNSKYEAIIQANQANLEFEIKKCAQSAIFRKYAVDDLCIMV